MGSAVSTESVYDAGVPKKILSCEYNLFVD